MVASQRQVASCPVGRPVDERDGQEGRSEECLAQRLDLEESSRDRRVVERLLPEVEAAREGGTLACEYQDACAAGGCSFDSSREFGDQGRREDVAAPRRRQDQPDNSAVDVDAEYVAQDRTATVTVWMSLFP
jgi:hypothetical protein